jgi:2-methylisocitrate lyase-like PEP mutase family enzyme
MDMQVQREKAERLRDLHRGPGILVLPNAWDAAGAALFAEAGFSAIGTTSAGIANALGYTDGERISRDEMLAMVERIAAAVALPVTADMEAGYGDAVATAEGVIAAGAVGLNFEDATDAGPEPLAGVAVQVEKIQAIREVGAARGVPLVVNARTDVYLRQVGDPDGRFDEAVRRLNAYRSAGADCLFAPGVRDAETIGRLARAVGGPLNILAGAGTPSIPELERLGVARVSVGSGAMRATLGLLRRIAVELRDQGTFTALTEGALSYDEANRLLDARFVGH